MRQINLRGVDYDYPEQNDVSWGNEATDYAEALANVINTLAPDTDIEDTVVTGLIEDGTWRNIPFLSLNSNEVLAAEITLMVYRSGGSEAENSLMEFSCTWNANTSEWDAAICGAGNSDVQFDLITTGTTGQWKFNANNIGSTVFKMRFRSLSMPA